jgi:hypothetical protein
MLVLVSQLTHEVGHWLNLDHTHQGGCGGVGDYMSTISGGKKSCERSATYNCPVGLNNCSMDGGNNPIHNFMSYAQVSLTEKLVANVIAFLHRVLTLNIFLRLSG